MHTWYDASSDSDMLVYNETEWVAYMSNNVKASRIDEWKAFNFVGTVDWAIDIQQFIDDDGDNDASSSTQ